MVIKHFVYSVTAFEAANSQICPNPLLSLPEFSEKPSSNYVSRCYDPVFCSFSPLCKPLCYCVQQSSIKQIHMLSFFYLLTLLMWQVVPKQGSVYLFTYIFSNLCAHISVTLSCLRVVELLMSRTLFSVSTCCLWGHLAKRGAGVSGSLLCWKAGSGSIQLPLLGRGTLN